MVPIGSGPKTLVAVFISGGLFFFAESQCPSRFVIDSPKRRRAISCPAPPPPDGHHHAADRPVNRSAARRSARGWRHLFDSVTPRTFPGVAFRNASLGLGASYRMGLAPITFTSLLKPLPISV